MPSFSLKYPYFIVVGCFIVSILGIVSIARLPVDLFPTIKIPVVAVATFYNGMPPEQIETTITYRFERFFTLGSNIDHIESSSLPGVSIIKIYFQPGTNADSAVSNIANLAMADLARLPVGTLPPIVLKFDASTLPVGLVGLKAKNLNQATIRDFGQFAIRDQLATVPGASVPFPFGGKYRQIMVYVDPLKLEAYQLSAMDVVRTINDSNLILPIGFAFLGQIYYNLFSNNQTTLEELNSIPLKTIGTSSAMVKDLGYAKDDAAIQTTIVLVDGKPSVYLPILRQGGDSNTIAIVDGIKKVLSNLVDIPQQLATQLFFDQSLYIRSSIKSLVFEGTLGLGLTALMILIFLGSLRATLASFFSIPLSVLGTFMILAVGGNSINIMILGGMALAFSRLIDDSVVVLENIYRHLELGEPPVIAAEKGAMEVSLPVLASTVTTGIVFLPVVLLYGVSKYLFSALALSAVIALALSYIVAMTVVPLFCATFLKQRIEPPFEKKGGSST